jgi:putative ABC transport system permease protein
LEPIGSPPDDRLVYIDQDTFNEIFPEIGDRVDQISVQLSREKMLMEVAERVKKRLLQTRGVKERNIDFTISTPEELLNSFSAILNIITAFLLGVAAISLVVGGIGVANTMYTAILERVKEIGVMKAIGRRIKIFC